MRDTDAGGVPLFHYGHGKVRHRHFSIDPPLGGMLDSRLLRVEMLLLNMDTLKVWSSSTPVDLLSVGGRLGCSSLRASEHLRNRLDFIRHVVYSWRSHPEVTSEHAFLHSL